MRAFAFRRLLKRRAWDTTGIWPRATRWSRKASRTPSQRHRRGPRGTSSRKRLRDKTRKQELESRNSGAVGDAVNAHKSLGPASDRNNSREAGSKSEEGTRVSSCVQAGRGSLLPSWQRLSEGAPKKCRRRAPAVSKFFLLLYHRRLYGYALYWRQRKGQPFATARCSAISAIPIRMCICMRLAANRLRDLQSTRSPGNKSIFFRGPFCDWSAVVPVQEGEAAPTRCFLRGQRLYARVQGCSSLVRGKLATGKALAEQGLVAFNTGGASEGKPKETGTEDSGGREGEQGGPTGSEGRNGCRMLQAATVEAQHGPGMHRARRRTNWEASGLQQLPTLSARTTSRHLCERSNSG